MQNRDAPSLSAGLSHGFETVDGVRIHYVSSEPRDAGTIVLLAGYPESWFAWRKIIPLLQSDHQLIAIDLPGQGDSDRPLEGYDTSSVSNVIHGLLEQIGARSYHLVGHDVGAWVAFSYAHLFSSEIRTLTLLDAGIPGVTLPDALPTAPDRAWRTWHFAFHVIADLPEALIAGREAVYLDWFIRRKAADPTTFSDADMAEYLRIFTIPGGLRAGLAFYRSAARSAEQNRQLVARGKLLMPVLALSADQGSIPNMAEPLSTFADDVRGETLARCGHFLPEEQPGEVARLLREFIRATSN